MSSSLIKTAHAFCHAFDDLDIDAHLALRSPGCIQSFGPASLDPPPPKSNAEFATHLAGLKTVLKAFPVRAKEVLESEKERRVSIWATSQAVFHDELKDTAFSDAEWDYRGEYLFILSMDESGKIERIFEFLDSKKTEKLREIMHHARQNRLKLEGKGDGGQGKMF